MTFTEALEVLKRGGKVRRPSVWSHTVALRDGVIVEIDYADRVVCKLETAFWQDILATDWTEVTP